MTLPLMMINDSTPSIPDISRTAACMLAGSSSAAMMPKASCFIFVLLSILPFSFFCAGVRSRALDMDGKGKALLVAENASPATG
jgi:hypothetical protein